MSYPYALGTYGFTTDTNVMSFPEERRQWRVKIEDHITEKAEEINNNIDEESDRIDAHIDTVETKIDRINTYIVETVKPELDDIQKTVHDVNSYVTGQLTEYVDDVEGATSGQAYQNTILRQILDKVRVLPNTWYWN